MSDFLNGFPTAAPAAPLTKLRWADVAVTPTAKEFDGFYRGKQYHPRDFEAVLQRATDAGVEKIMLTGMSLKDVQLMLEIAKANRGLCSFTVGVHPYHANEPYEDPTYFTRLAETIKELISQHPKLISAVGELGLDYDRTAHASKAVQIQTFKAQLDMVTEEKFDLPLFLHCRNSFHDFVEIIKPYVSRLPRGGLVHSFVGSKEEMRALVDLGFHVSVNGFSFHDRESLEMVRSIPLDKLQIETDAPWGEIAANSEVAKRYLTNVGPAPPKKKRDKFELGLMVKDRNESNMLDRIAFIVAGLRGTTVEEIANAAWENSTAMFRL